MRQADINRLNIITQCSPAKGVDWLGRGGLFFCRGEVEEHLVKASFMFPVADVVFDAVLLMLAVVKNPYYGGA